MIFVSLLTAMVVATSANDLMDSDECVANATQSADCVAKGSPLMQKVVTKSINGHDHKREDIITFAGFAIDDSGNRGHWEANWDTEVTSLTMIDPIRPDDKMLNDSLNDGTIDRRYKSWYMPGGPQPPLKGSRGPRKGEPKFYHEVGVTMAHRKAWQALVDGANNDNNRWGVIFEGDAILRADIWRWMRHLRTVLSTGSPPFMVWLGHCYESCYQQQDSAWRDGDFCLKGNEDNNPHNVSGCMLHYQSAICPVGYLISRESAQKMLELTTPMNCAVDEKFRYEIQRNNWDARILCDPLVIQPWQHEQKDKFSEHGSMEATMKQRGYLRSNSSHRLLGEVRDASICGPPGDWVRTIERWP